MIFSNTVHIKMKSPYVDQPDSYHFEFLMGMGEIMAISKKYLTVCLLFFLHQPKSNE